MSQLGKIILRVMLNRICSQIRPDMSVERYGLVKGIKIANVILLHGMMSEKAIEMQRDVFMLFNQLPQRFCYRKTRGNA